MDTSNMLAKIPEVQEVHNIAGEDCYLLKIRAADPQSLGRIIRAKVRSINSVLGTNTTIVLGTVQKTAAFPLRARTTEVLRSYLGSTRCP